MNRQVYPWESIEMKAKLNYQSFENTHQQLAAVCWHTSYLCRVVAIATPFCLKLGQTVQSRTVHDFTSNLSGNQTRPLELCVLSLLTQDDCQTYKILDSFKMKANFSTTYFVLNITLRTLYCIFKCSNTLCLSIVIQMTQILLFTTT